MKIFFFFDFQRKLEISEKITKSEHFKNRPNMTIPVRKQGKPKNTPEDDLDYDEYYFVVIGVFKL